MDLHLPTTRAKSPIERLLQPPAIYGVVSLALLGLAAFFFVLTYLDSTRAPKAAETAAAASAATHVFDRISIAAKSAIVVDLATGETLYEKNADAQLPLASLTKVMLALTVAESLPTKNVIRIPFTTAPLSGTGQLRAGESWEVQKVVDYTLIASSNDGADILAAAAESAIRAKFLDAPGTGATLWRMNGFAKELGLNQTYFLNDNGLDISLSQSGAYGSARDMATLFSYAALHQPRLFAATAENGMRLVSETGSRTSAQNTNEALDDIPGLMMGKTGYTDLAGGNLGVVFDVGLAHPVVAIVLGSSYDGRFADMETLVERARAAVTEE